jgi:hypothetical protein
VQGPGANANICSLGKENQPGNAGVSLGVAHTVVLHFEEMDFLGVHQDKAAEGTHRAVSSDWRLYDSCVLGKALTLITREVRNLRVALSVRLSSRVHKLIFPPGVPCASIPLSPALPEEIKLLLNQYLVGRADESTIEDLSERLEGPFRLVQKFLFEVHLRKEQPFTAGVIQDCIDSSYAEMRLELLAHLDLYGQANKGLLHALCALWKEASETRRCRLTSEVRARLSGIVAAGLLKIQVLEGWKYADVARLAPFYKYVLDSLESQ